MQRQKSIHSSGRVYAYLKIHSGNGNDHIMPALLSSHKHGKKNKKENELYFYYTIFFWLGCAYSVILWVYEL